MRLITYTTKNAPHVKLEKKTAAKDFMVFRSSGIIQLNLALTKLLKIQDGARIALHQDAQYPSDWYVSLTDKPEGFKATILKSKGCTIQSNQLVGLVAASVSVNKDSAAPPKSFRIDVERYPTEKEFYGLCTAKVNTRM